MTANEALEEAVEKFQPEVILRSPNVDCVTLLARLAQRHRLPLAGLFLDWFPVMQGALRPQIGRSGSLEPPLSWSFYAACDLAFCTSDGMQDILGPHREQPRHLSRCRADMLRAGKVRGRRRSAKFRLAYVGSVENFYGRMLCSLIERIEATNDLEIIVVGPNADWPKPLVERARANGTYLGFKPPEEAAQVLATADALLSVMGYEKEHELFMRTSFTTKFLDYVAFGKPVILWGPEYCTPVGVAREHGGAAVVTTDDPGAVVSLSREIAADTALNQKLSKASAAIASDAVESRPVAGDLRLEIEKLARSIHG